MRVIKPLWIACVAALALTAALAWIPNALLHNEAPNRELAVFRGEPIQHLTSGNIVDVLARAELHEKLGRAEWKNAVLSLELSVPPDSGRPEIWFRDIAKLVELSFSQLDNVQRLLVKIVDKIEGDKRQLAAVDIRKTDGWLAEEAKPVSEVDPVHDELWRKRLRASFTAAWEERFGPVRPYRTDSI